MMKPTVEYQMLGLMALIFLFAYVPASVAKAKTFGTRWLASNRDSKPSVAMPAWGERCERAHQNLKDNLPGFIVAVLGLGVTDGFSDLTQWLTITYVIARIVHFASYGMGNVPIRAMSYMVGLVVNSVLLLKLISG